MVVRSPLFIYFEVMEDTYLCQLQETQLYLWRKKASFFPLTTNNRQLTSRSNKHNIKGIYT